MRLAATDLAFRRNASAMVLMRVDCERLIVDGEVELVPSGRPLVPSEVCGEFCRRAVAYGADAMAGDVHYRDTAIEYAREYGLGWRDIVAAHKSDAYTFARVLVRERRVEFRGVPLLVEQLASTRVQYLSGGGLSVDYVGSGIEDGRHGDLVSAFVGGAFLLAAAIRRGETSVLGDGRRVVAAIEDDWGSSVSRPLL